MKVVRIIALMGLAFSVASCASIARGTTETFTITTAPSGAYAMFTNGYVCTTPCSLQMKHKAEFSVTFEMEGYKTVELYIDSRGSGTGAATATVGNALIGGAPGFVVDIFTGAMKKLAPNPAHIVMQPGEGTIRLAARMGTEDITEIPEGITFKDFINKKDKKR